MTSTREIKKKLGREIEEQVRQKYAGTLMTSYEQFNFNSCHFTDTPHPWREKNDLGTLWWNLSFRKWPILTTLTGKKIRWTATVKMQVTLTTAWRRSKNRGERCRKKRQKEHPHGRARAELQAEKVATIYSLPGRWVPVDFDVGVCFASTWQWEKFIRTRTAYVGVHRRVNIASQIEQFRENGRSEACNSTFSFNWQPSTGLWKLRNLVTSSIRVAAIQSISVQICRPLDILRRVLLLTRLISVLDVSQKHLRNIWKSQQQQ